MDKLYKIGELAAQFGISQDTLRLYDELGILPAKKNAGNGYRIYDRTDLICLVYILRLRRAGMPLDEIRLLLTEGSLNKTIDALKDQLEVFAARLRELELSYIRAADGLAELEETARGLGCLRLETSPRMICRVCGNDVAAGIREFGAIHETRAPRFSFIIRQRFLTGDYVAEWLADCRPREERLEQAMILLDGESALSVPPGKGFFVYPPQRCIYSIISCRMGQDYRDLGRVFRYAQENHLTICGDLIIVVISLRNDVSRDLDYYQVWLPVKDA